MHTNVYGVREMYYNTPKQISYTFSLITPKTTNILTFFSYDDKNYVNGLLNAS